jgi:hypothetical protein
MLAILAPAFTLDLVLPIAGFIAEEASSSCAD